MWTHGKHPFDNSDKEDLALLEEMQEKAKTSKFYQKASYIWSIDDVEKRKIAKENNLNYLEVFSVNLETFKKSLERYLQTYHTQPYQVFCQ